MQIYNPTKEKISVMIKGVSYECEPEDSIYNIPEEIAREWQENTHKFIQIKKDKLEDSKKEEAVEVPAPKVETVIAPEVEVTPEVETPTAEIKEEVKEEAPKVSKKSTKKVK